MNNEHAGTPDKGGHREHHAHHYHGEDGHHYHHGPWKLNVQGVVIESPRPEITVREAIRQAGFSPDTPWIIILKIAGEAKKEVDLSYVIDLRHRGIEKLRLTPRQINNGETAVKLRADFAMLPQDEEHLDHLGLHWETLVDGGRRWLIVQGYPLPPGYSAPAADIAIEVPVAYPGAQLDMFYCHPALALQSGGAIAQTQQMETITARPFQRWSRHRSWDAARDTLATHLALVDESLRREVGQ
ncbi:E2/UBC family protein [Methylocystis sp.]|uniref:E2/UBC family protein n=1 Tax=Methylocystis sp. TaxID=1911079 RepID=UPI003DA35151